MRRSLLPVAIAIGAAALVAGCGTSDDEASAGFPAGKAPITRVQFLAKANAACAKQRVGLRAQIAAFYDLHRGDGTPRPALYAELAHRVLLPTIEAEMFQLEELRAPPRVRDSLTKILTVERAGVDEIALAERIESIESVARRFAAADRQLSAFGLQGCAEGPLP